MKRRAYLLALGTTVSLPGCTLFGGETDAISVTSPTIEQGESAVISIEADSVRMIRLSKTPGESDIFDDGEPLRFDFKNATFSPSPEIIWLAEPPTWDWQSTQDVKGEIPIQTFSDTPRATFHCTVIVYQGSQKTENTQEAAITIESRS